MRACLPTVFFSAGYPSFATALLGFPHDNSPTAPQKSGSSSSAVLSRTVDSPYSIVSNFRISNTAIPRCALLVPDVQKTIQAEGLPMTRVNLTNQDDTIASSLQSPVLPPNRECAPKQASRTHVVVPRSENNRHSMYGIADDNKHASGKKRNSALLSANFRHEERNTGFPQDVVDILQQLEDLADWVRAASRKLRPAASSTKFLCGSHNHSRGRSPTSWHMASRATALEGKISTPFSNDTKSEQETYVNASGPATSRAFSIPTVTQGYRRTMDSLHDSHNITGLPARDSRSLITYPVYRRSQFHQPPSGAPATSLTHQSAYYRRTMDDFSVPSSPRAVHHIASVCGKISPESSLQRCRWKTSVIPPAIPVDHVPIESPYSQRKRMRFPSLKL